MIPGLFITATGTDVGKTLVTAGLLRWCIRRSLGAAVMKPVQTGAHRRADGSLTAPDLETVYRAAGLPLDAELRRQAAPCLYEPACSPHLAARQAGRPVDLAAILRSYHWLAARHPFVLVEGAGGVLVPLSERETMADLMAALQLPVLLVAHAGLGTLNHTLLSLEALRRRSLDVFGVILNDRAPATDGDRYIREDNVRAIEAFGETRVLACIPHLGAHPDWTRLDDTFSACDFTRRPGR